MNPNFEKLFQIAKKPTRTIVGLMSGTSIDGLDIAVCQYSGSGTSTSVELIKFQTVPYDSLIKSKLESIFCKQVVQLQDVCLLNPWLGSLHGEILLNCLRQWEISPDSVDIVASHGQTIYHAPKSHHRIPDLPNSTLQIGDGDHVAVKTGIITISDFRQKHIATGGEGAPLAIYGDFLLFSSKKENRIMLNIGGIANYTFLPANGNVNDILSTDTGPGNTLMDSQCKLHFGQEFDANGAIAATGKIQLKLLQALKNDPFFNSGLPRSTGQELFNVHYVRQAQDRSSTVGIEIQDLIATLNRFTAESIAEAIRKGVDQLVGCAIFVSGGGTHNLTLMKNMKEILPECSFLNFETLGIPSDAKEAVLFATLANEAVSGGKLPWTSFGKLSFPN